MSPTDDRYIVHIVGPYVLGMMVTEILEKTLSVHHKDDANIQVYLTTCDLLSNTTSAPVLDGFAAHIYRHPPLKKKRLILSLVVANDHGYCNVKFATKMLTLNIERNSNKWAITRHLVGCPVTAIRMDGWGLRYRGWKGILPWVNTCKLARTVIKKIQTPSCCAWPGTSIVHG